MKNLIQILFLLFSFHYGYAQPYYFKHYQVENGLSNNTVFCSVQDVRGFMWFGTKDGLNRFDGYSFKTYRHDPANAKTIGNDLIYYLHSDQQGLLWVGTSKGLYSYDPVNESFTLLQNTARLNIHKLQSDDDGNLWIIASSRIYVYNKARKTFYAFGKNAPFNANVVFVAKDKTIWVGTVDGTIEHYDKRSNSFTSYHVMNRNDGGGFGTISAIKEGIGNQLVIGTSTQGLKLFDTQTKVPADLITLNRDKTHIFVRELVKSGANEFWAGTESGIYVYNNLTGAITHLEKQYNNSYTLSDNAVYSLCRDREGGIWSGTYFGGINYYSAQYSVFTKYFPGQQPNSISGSDVREICKDDSGNFWIGTEDAGLNKLDPRTGTFTTFSPNGTNKSIAHSNVHGLLADGTKLWIGTFEHGIDLMDIKTGRIIKHYSAWSSALKSNFVLTFYKTRAGVLILATTAGLYTYNPQKDDFDLVDGLPVIFYNSVHEGADGSIWAGTFSEGLFHYQPGRKGVQHFFNVKGQANSLTNNTINSIFEDSRKNTWITTDGGGLCLYRKKDHTFKHFTTKDGLPSNFLFRIEEDKAHKLWISSTRGLIHFDPLTGGSKTYTKADGLLTDQFNYSSSYQDSNGRIYFGSVKGLISFDPGAFRANAYAAPVFATNFNIDNNENSAAQAGYPLSKSIQYTDTIILRNSQSSFSINFAALSYFSPEMTEYAYKMSGLYKDWEYLKTNRKVYFTKLAPGKYVFEAKALINGSKDWSTKNVKLYIQVLPPFWQSPAAITIYILLLLVVISYFVKRYNQRLIRKNRRRMEVFEHEKEKEIYQAKIEFFTSISHEIRTPLTLIKGPMEKLIKQAHEVPAMEKNLRVMDRNTDRLLNLTNQLLDFRKTEINGFSLNFVKADIAEILADITLNFHSLAEQKKISIHTDFPKAPFYAYVDTEALHKIISNLIDNAIKYGLAEIRISLFTSPKNADYFEISIINDGPLIPPALQHKVFEPFYRIKEAEIRPGTGIGLSISRSLAELHQGKLEIKKNNLTFNIFVLTLPVHQLIEFNLNKTWKKH